MKKLILLPMSFLPAMLFCMDSELAQPSKVLAKLSSRYATNNIIWQNALSNQSTSAAICRTCLEEATDIYADLDNFLAVPALDLAVRRQAEELQRKTQLDVWRFTFHLQFERAFDSAYPVAGSSKT
jgi:hypothetical protein